MFASPFDLATQKKAGHCHEAVPHGADWRFRFEAASQPRVHCVFPIKHFNLTNEIHCEPSLPYLKSVFDTAERHCYHRSIGPWLLPFSPRRLAWPRTSPFHGGNTGSNPVGDANKTFVL
jgi:hypothetical protein